MEGRKTLLIDIDAFVKNAIEYSNTHKKNAISEYFNLESRILALNENDFESNDKYDFFLNFYKQPKRCAEKFLFEREFKEDCLSDGKFLWMCNYLLGIVERIK